MSVSYLNNAASGTMALFIGCFLAIEVYAKPRSAPLPDRNPKRISAPAAEAAQEKVKRIANPAGLVAKLPQLLNYELSDADRAALKSTISTVYKGRFDSARNSMARIRDKTARKLAQWYFYRRQGNNSDPERIERFRLANPDWPSQKRLQRNAEAALLTGQSSPEKIKRFFARTKPLSGAGLAALAGAHLATGNKQKSVRLISEAWRKYDFDRDDEKFILGKFGKQLTAQDHKARVDRLLLLDRKSMISTVLRTAQLLNKSEQRKINARIAVVRRSKTARKLLADIPDDEVKGDVGFYFSRIQWLRRQKKKEAAWKLLLAAPTEPDALIALNDWWIERRVNCRAALNSGRPKIAYEIARNRGPLTGRNYQEAEFLAGWIALQFLGKPELAQQHFLALRTAASSPQAIAKSEYWLARVTGALGSDEETRVHLENAAKFPFTYYGQIARQTIEPAPGALPLPPAPAPSRKDFENLRKRDAVKTIALIRAAKLETLAPLFFLQLARTIESPGEAFLLAKLAAFMQQPFASVRLSKIAFNRGLPLAEQAYPTNLLPEYKKIGEPVEPALLYALSRQESEFNPVAKSPVGARGLMQIMPGTARAIARQYKVRYRRSKLTKDPSYNVMLGAAHLADLLASYNGSYILTLVAYNAGGGRVRRWTQAFGDPRAKNVDAIDWVERIPFTETRNYVKKILTGLQIFRSRLNGPQGALQIVSDLNRGQPGSSEKTAPAETTPIQPVPASASN